VVSAVAASPPADGTLDGTAANKGEPDTQGHSGRVRAVSPKTMVSCYGQPPAYLLDCLNHLPAVMPRPVKK
jgi:hypothetical protein